MSLEVVAHRGNGGSALENTLDAFLGAQASGADSVEFDVRTTADGRFVIHHDPIIGRREIAQATLAELQREAVDRGYDLSTLDDVVAALSGGIRLDVEIKDRGNEKGVVDTVLRAFDSTQFIVTSFHEASLATLSQYHPSLNLGLLVGLANPRNVLFQRFREVFPMGRAKSLGARIVAPHYRLLRFGFLGRAARVGLGVYPWTVNDPEMIERLVLRPEVTGIISDNPGACMAARDRHGRK